MSISLYYKFVHALSQSRDHLGFVNMLQHTATKIASASLLPLSAESIKRRISSRIMCPQAAECCLHMAASQSLNARSISLFFALDMREKRRHTLENKSDRFLRCHAVPPALFALAKVRRVESLWRRAGRIAASNPRKPL